MDPSMYPPPTSEIAHKRRELAPRQLDAFKAFSAAVFAEGALPVKTKQLIAVAVAHVTQCPYCIRGHTEGGAAPRPACGRAPAHFRVIIFGCLWS